MPMQEGTPQKCCALGPAVPKVGPAQDFPKAGGRAAKKLGFPESRKEGSRPGAQMPRRGAGKGKLVSFTLRHLMDRLPCLNQRIQKEALSPTQCNRWGGLPTFLHTPVYPAGPLSYCYLSNHQQVSPPSASRSSQCGCDPLQQLPQHLLLLLQKEGEGQLMGRESRKVGCGGAGVQTQLAHKSGLGQVGAGWGKGSVPVLPSRRTWPGYAHPQLLACACMRLFPSCRHSLPSSKKDFRWSPSVAGA